MGDDKPPNASCLLELGSLSLAVKCLLTDVPLFMELAEENKRKNKASREPDKHASGPVQPRRLAGPGARFCPNAPY